MKKTIRKMLCVVCLLAAMGVACYAGLIALVYHWEVSVPQATEYDRMIVLGAQVQPSGEPSVQLKWRLEKAAEYYWQKPCYMVVTGGQGAKEPEPEGDVMKRVLLEMGIPEEHVISDPLAMDTKQNIRNGWAILQEKGCTTPLIVTSDYHVPRALAIARDNGLDPLGAGSPCRPELKFWLKNHMREALAWVKYWGIKYLHLPL